MGLGTDPVFAHDGTERAMMGECATRSERFAHVHPDLGSWGHRTPTVVLAATAWRPQRGLGCDRSEVQPLCPSMTEARCPPRPPPARLLHRPPTPRQGARQPDG